MVSNWKMNLLSSDVKEYVSKLKFHGERFCKICNIIVCPPFTSLHIAVEEFRNSGFFVGAQNMNENQSGAYTGEISCCQLKDLGVSHVLIGHSERREIYGETDSVVNKKISTALSAKMQPIICVGESLVHFEMGTMFDVISLQVKTALFGLNASEVSRLIIAYEPIWAIGTGQSASSEYAEKICSLIRDVVCNLFDKRVSDNIVILYGGSTTEKTASALFAQRNIDGFLMGGVTLSPNAFASILDVSLSHNVKVNVQDID